MKVLIGCEESQTVCIEFRKRGHEAYSCDIQPCSGGHPEWHIQDDVLKVITRERWGMGIFFPECKYSTSCANRHFPNNPDRWQKRLNAMVFDKNLLESNIEKIALENPIGAICTWIRKPDQIINPYHFGHRESKKTGLWLKNLPILKHTNVVEPEWRIAPNGKRYNPFHWSTPSTDNPENAKLRSKTYPGIAKAMAEQWG